MRLFIFLILIISSLELQAQSNWPHIGTIWHYSVLESPGHTKNEGYIKIYVDRDTVIDSTPCRLLEVEYHLPYQQLYRNQEYLYSDAGVVYKYSKRKETFYTLYDFNAQPGDTWFINEYDTATITVDSVSTVVINEQSMKAIHTSSNNAISFSYNIVAGIGDTDIYFFCDPGVSDVNAPAGLRCYSDNLIGEYRRQEYPDCEQLITSNLLKEEQHALSIYPTIFSNEVFISTNNNHESDLWIHIYTIHGEEITSVKVSKTIQNIGLNVPSGIYVVVCQLNHHQILTQKIIKL